MIPLKTEIFGVELENRVEFERFVRVAIERLKEAEPSARIDYARVRLMPEGIYFTSPSSFNCTLVLLYEREGPVIARAKGESPFVAASRALEEIRLQLKGSTSVAMPLLGNKREASRLEEPLAANG